jgi:hypothetical protein
MAGLVPVIPLRWTLSCKNRDARVKPAHDARDRKTFQSQFSSDIQSKPPGKPGGVVIVSA